MKLTDKQVDRAKRIADKYITRDGQKPGASIFAPPLMYVATRGPGGEMIRTRCYSMEHAAAELEKRDRS